VPKVDTASANRSTTVVTKTFNATLPLAGAVLEQPTEAELRDVRCFKYADYDYVYGQCGSDYVRHVLDCIPILNKHKRVLIDVKVHDLKPSNVPCVPGWHLDGSVNPEGLPKRPETLTIFVTGCMALTKFLDEPIKLDVTEGLNFAAMNRVCARMIPKDHPTHTISSCQFATYNDTYFHTGTAAQGVERRLLVRTTETDIIKPQNRIYTPHTHK